MKTSNTLLITRSILKLVKQPTAPVLGFIMSLFFLIVYNAGIGGIGYLDAFGEKGYLAFIFPITIISLAMGSSSGAGQTLYADMQSGYFRRMYLSPASRRMLVLAPMLADTLSSVFLTGMLLAIGVLFGLPFQFGLLSASGVLLLSMLWAITLCGFSAGVMLRTGKHQSAAIITNAVFPLLFLSTTFLPRELIISQWLISVSWANPVTYVLEANRYLLGGTASRELFLLGLLILTVTALTSSVFAFNSAGRIKV